MADNDGKARDLKNDDSLHLAEQVRAKLIDKVSERIAEKFAEKIANKYMNQKAEHCGDPPLSRPKSSDHFTVHSIDQLTGEWFCDDCVKDKLDQSSGTPV